MGSGLAFIHCSQPHQFKKDWARLSVEMQDLTPYALSELVKSEGARWTPILKSAQVTQ